MNNTVKEWKIHDIEGLSEAAAAEMAEEAMEIKGFTVYLVDIGGYFGFSALVYKNGRAISYANDYELHHSGKSREELRTLYSKKMNAILFTDEEIAAPLESYDDFTAKEYFVRNYYPMQEEHRSIFFSAPDRDDFPFYSPVAFAWFKDKDFCNHISDLLEILYKRKAEVKNSYEYQKAAFLYELANHEYHINPYQGDFDTLSVFGQIEWGGEDAPLKTYFDQLKFTEVQRRAYVDAVNEHMKNALKNGWF